MLTSILVPSTVKVCASESLLVTVRVASGVAAMQPGANVESAMLTEVDVSGFAQSACGGSDFERVIASRPVYEDMLLALRCLDLTSLAPGETPEGIRALCRVACSPGLRLPPVAAVCIGPQFVELAREGLEGSRVMVACATGAFPTGVAASAVRAREIDAAIRAGAQEIDTVLDHAALLAGNEEAVLDQLVASREACGGAVMKVIVEAGAYPVLPFVHRASELAIAAGADFVKTSTGVGFAGATPEAVLTIAQAVASADRPVGIKVSGGVKTAADALGYLVLVTRALGADWRSPARFRVGASGLVAALIAAIGEAD